MHFRHWNKGNTTKIIANKIKIHIIAFVLVIKHRSIDCVGVCTEHKMNNWKKQRGISCFLFLSYFSGRWHRTRESFDTEYFLFDNQTALWIKQVKSIWNFFRKFQFCTLFIFVGIFVLDKIQIFFACVFYWVKKFFIFERYFSKQILSQSSTKRETGLCAIV